MIIREPERAAALFEPWIAGANRILLLTHVNPDGDAVGSLLAMWHALASMGKSVIPMLMPPLPSYTRWLPGTEQIHYYQRGDSLPTTDLIIFLDAYGPSRVGTIYDEHVEEFESVPWLVIDHHVIDDGVGVVNLVRTSSASTCELLTDLFRAMNVHLSAEIATCLLLGHTTDTQSFQTSATTAKSFRVSATLIEAGASHTQVIHAIYKDLPASSAVLIGRALVELHAEEHLVWSTITRTMLHESAAEDDATNEVVRMLQRIGTARAVVLFKERTDGTTKISLRSRAPYNVAALAQRWGGGGHAQAAGATLQMPTTQAEREVLPLLRALVAE